MNTFYNKKLILILGATALSTGLASESWAEVHGDNCNNSSTYGQGTNCQWTITDEGVLIVERKDKNLSASTGSYDGATAPWDGYNIRAVVLDGVSLPNHYGLGQTGFSSMPKITINDGNYSSLVHAAHFTPYNCTTDLNDCLLARNLGCSRGYQYINNSCSGCKSGYLEKGDECLPASQGCGENYRLSDGICYRVRYTPAEAAQVAGETNTVFLYYK